MERNGRPVDRAVKVEGKMNNNQAYRVLEYMRRNGSITAREADRRLGVMRLASRVSDLRRKGHNIKSTLIRVPTRDGYTRVASYSVVE